MATLADLYSILVKLCCKEPVNLLNRAGLLALACAIEEFFEAYIMQELVAILSRLLPRACLLILEHGRYTKVRQGRDGAGGALEVQSC